MSTIPYFAPGQLALFPEVVAARLEAAVAQCEAFRVFMLDEARQIGALAHVMAILSPYHVAAMTEVAIERAYREASTTEEAEEAFFAWVEEVERTYLFDRE